MLWRLMTRLMKDVMAAHVTVQYKPARSTTVVNRVA